MTPEEQSRVISLVIYPGGPEERDPADEAEFLKSFGTTDGSALGLELLKDALTSRDSTDVELALIVGFVFKMTEDYRPLLESLAYLDWHQSHEDVASALGDVGAASSVDALVHLAEWVPEYLEFDDARALAIKCVWSISAIPGEESHRALLNLSRSDNSLIAECAKARLER